jgi:hypothetical protein
LDLEIVFEEHNHCDQGSQIDKTFDQVLRKIIIKILII